MSHLFTAVELSEKQANQPVVDLDRIVAVVCNHFLVDEQEILDGSQNRSKRSPARAVTMYLCQKIGQMSLAEIAQTFDLKSYSSAATTIRKAREKIDADTELRDIVDGILLDLAL